MILSCCSSASDSGLNSLTALKEAVLIAIRTPPPPRSDRSLLNIVKPECNVYRVAVFFFFFFFLVQPCLIGAYNVRAFGVHQVLEEMEVTHGLPVCCAVFVITI